MALNEQRKPLDTTNQPVPARTGPGALGTSTMTGFGLEEFSSSSIFSHLQPKGISFSYAYAHNESEKCMCCSPQKHCFQVLSSITLSHILRRGRKKQGRETPRGRKRRFPCKKEMPVAFNCNSAVYLQKQRQICSP